MQQFTQPLNVHEAIHDTVTKSLQQSHIYLLGRFIGVFPIRQNPIRRN